MNLNRDEIFLICKKLKLKDFLNFSMVNKRIYSLVDKNWKYKLLEFDKTNLQSENLEGRNLQGKRLYILLSHLSNLKKSLRLGGSLSMTYGLKYLDLNNCNLGEIPKEMRVLSNLEELRLKYNQIREIQNVPLSIKKLYLSYNKLRSISEKVGNLKNLEILFLGYNSIRELPPELGKLTKLQNLSLDDNQLRTLPVEMKELKNLRYLYLTNNDIKYIPKEIETLPNINIYYNPYTINL